MLKHPDKFLPVTTGGGFHALVSSGFNGDLRIKDTSTGDLYFNFFASGLTFLRVIESEKSKGRKSWEKRSNDSRARRAQ